MVAVGIGLLYLGNQHITPGYLATASGILIEFTSAVFFYFYNRTVQSMAEYHQKLVITQNVSLALETANRVQGQNQEVAQLDIIHELVRDINAHLSTATDVSSPRNHTSVPVRKTQNPRKKVSPKVGDVE
jgi:hypothetical protein